MPQFLLDSEHAVQILASIRASLSRMSLEACYQAVQVSVLGEAFTNGKLRDNCAVYLV